MDQNQRTDLPDLDIDVFSSAIGTNLKTYITAGVGIVTMFLSGFDIVELTEKQTLALTGGLIFLAFIFTRLAIARGQKDSALAAQASVQTLQHQQATSEAVQSLLDTDSSRRDAR